MAYSIAGRFLDDEVRKILTKKNKKSASSKRSDDSTEETNNNNRTIILIIVVIYLGSFIWWLSIFFRASSQLSDKSDVTIVFLLNLLLSPAAGEIALQFFRKR